MPYPNSADSEAARLAALHLLGVLDTPPVPALDALVKAASLVCGVPIALLSLLDQDRQWFKANHGLPDMTQTPRDVAFCDHTIRGDELLEVRDATLDLRFADNPLVTSQPGIRFYAGVPLRLADGQRIGTLCVIDRQPGRLSDSQREILACLADTASQLLGAHRPMQGLVQAAQALSASERQLRRLYQATPAMMHSVDPQGRLLSVSDAWLARLGYRRETVLGQAWQSFVAPVWLGQANHPAQLALAQGGQCRELPLQMVCASGAVLDMLLSAVQQLDADGQPCGSLAVLEDMTARRQAELALAEEHQRLQNILDGTQAGTWEWNVHTGEVRINKRSAQIIGETLAGLGPQTIALRVSRTHADDMALSEAAARAHFAGRTEVYETETRLRHRDGHWVWVLARGRVLTRLPDGRPEWMFGTHQDISERMSTRLALQDAHTRMALATEGGGIGVWDWDLAQRSIAVDAMVCRLFGMPVVARVSQVGLHLQRVHPQDMAAARAAVLAALRGDRPMDHTFRIVHDDGSVHYLRTAARVSRNAAGRATRMIGVNWDVTELHTLADRLAEQAALLRITLQSIGDAVLTTDRHGHVEWLNPVAERMTGWLNAEAKGRPATQVFRIVQEESRLPALDPVATCLAQGEPVGLANQTVLISRNGIEYGIEDSASPIRDDAGAILGVVLVFHDVTEQRRLSGEMSYRATHDPLTGLVNRSEFETRIRRLLQKTREDHSQHALLYIDLDQFKLVNDACGHSAGDQLLQQVSKLLGDAVRNRDTLARLGGDEFAIILEHCTTEQAQRAAQLVCDRMEDYRFAHDGRRFRIGTSIGLVPVDARWTSTAAILQAADTACYAAKEAGRNRVHAWFDTDLTLRNRHGEMQWATRLEHALDENRFVLHAQRINALCAPGGQDHAEVLLRMVEADGSLVLPGAFLQAAERFNLVTRIDRWVLRKVIAWMAERPHIAGVQMLSVNLSGQSIGDRAFHRWAIEQLAEAGPTLCRRLCLEVTETAAVTNLADAAGFIERVRELGVRVALDDFGAGASSFGYLKNLKVDFLKIDGQFIRDLIDDPLDEAAVRCFADVARLVGIQTVAECVEAPAVLDRLRSIGIGYSQGYLLHRPAPIDYLMDESAMQAG